MIPGQDDGKLALATVGADALIAGRYRLVELIGSGGMGSVWRASDEVLGRTVAVKLLRPEFATDEASRRRFRAEARAVASISHPNVVSVFDYGEQPAANGESLSFLVMEFVPGRSLAQELAGHGTAPAHAVVAILEQTALGLSAAHAQRVVHRDIKPANLLLSPNRVIKITDFGIARWAEATPLTRTGVVIGTAQYLSPEQAEGQGATPESDLYSLGVVAFVCLNGAPPFRRETAVATLLAHVRDPVPPLPPETPPGLQSLVIDLLAKSPGDRPSAEEVVVRCRAGLLGTGRRSGAWRTAGPEETRVVASSDIQPSPAGGRVDNPSSTTRIPSLMGQSGRLPVRKRAIAVGSAAMIAVALVALLVALSTSSPAVKVPNVVGESLVSARSILGRAGLGVAVRRIDAPKHSGEVIIETPKAGTSLGHGKVVQLTVSSGLVNVTPSAYIGLPFSTAARRLGALGLHVIKRSVPGTANPGSVVSVSPAGHVAVGSAITVAVALTPPVTTTPSTTTPSTSTPPATLPPATIPPAVPPPPAHGHHDAPPGHGKGKEQNG